MNTKPRIHLVARRLKRGKVRTVCRAHVPPSRMTNSIKQVTCMSCPHERIQLRYRKWWI